MEGSKIQKKVETFSLDLPQRKPDVVRKNVQPADSLYQINKLGVMASFSLIGSDAAGSGNYQDVFFVAPVEMTISSWYLRYTVACSDSGATIILQKQQTGNTTSLGSLSSEATADTGYRGIVDLGSNGELKAGDGLRIAFSTGVTALDGLCVTVYMIPNNLGGFYNA